MSRQRRHQAACGNLVFASGTPLTIVDKRGDGTGESADITRCCIALFSAHRAITFAARSARARASRAHARFGSLAAPLHRHQHHARSLHAFLRACCCMTFRRQRYARASPHAVHRFAAALSPACARACAPAAALLRAPSARHGIMRWRQRRRRHRQSAPAASGARHQAAHLMRVQRIKTRS